MKQVPRWHLNKNSEYPMVFGNATLRWQIALGMSLVYMNIGEGLKKYEIKAIHNVMFTIDIPFFSVWIGYSWKK